MCGGGAIRQSRERTQVRIGTPTRVAIARKNKCSGALRKRGRTQQHEKTAARSTISYTVCVRTQRTHNHIISGTLHVVVYIQYSMMWCVSRCGVVASNYYTHSGLPQNWHILLRWPCDFAYACDARAIASKYK